MQVESEDACITIVVEHQSLELDNKVRNLPMLFVVVRLLLWEGFAPKSLRLNILHNSEGVRLPN